MQINLACDISWANGLVTLLGKQPYELVADIITSFKGQIAAQVAAATPATPVPPAPLPIDPAQPQALETEGTAAA